MKHTTQLSIVLLATQKEYQSGDVTACLDKYFKTNASVDKKIDLHIFFNKGEESDYNDLLDYENCENVNEVKIKSHKLEGLEDLYIRTPQEFKKFHTPEVPALGASSGPNNLFFNSMIPLMDNAYRDYLMIECDTYPIKDLWLDQIISYCDNAVFMIAGSTYLGKHQFPHFDTWTGHLNGVAIYRSSKNLSIFLTFAKKTIIHYVTNHHNPFVSFDVAMHYFSATLLGRQFFNNRNMPFNQLIDCPIISNYSLPDDFSTSTEEVKQKYPETIILHKKDSPKKIPVFLHIPKNAGTYVLNLMHSVHTHYRHLNLESKFDQSCVRMCFVKLDKVRQVTAFIYDENHHCENSDFFIKISPDQYESSADIFYKYLSESKFDLFSLQIDATQLGVRDEFNFCHKLCSIIGHTPSFFTILRSPFDRAQSIFNYLNSEDSSHEPTYNQITSKNLKSYIHSSQLEDSWVIRHLSSLNEEEPLTTEHFDEAVNQLHRFSFVGNMSNINETVYSVLHQCYGISRDLINFNLDSIGKNKSSYSSCKFDDLDIETQNKFICRTDLDIRLYDHFCNSENDFKNTIEPQPARDLIVNPTVIPVFHHIAKNAGTYVLSWMMMLCRKYHILRGDNTKIGWTASRIRRCLIKLDDGKQLTVIYYTPTDLSGSNSYVLEHSGCRKSDGSIDGHKLAEAQINFINSKFKSEGDGSTNIIPLQNFIKFIQNGEIEPFSISVDPIFWGGLQSSNSFSWKAAEEALSEILNSTNRKSLKNFAILRDPYLRAVSIFHYLKSPESAHEPNHNCLQSNTLKEFLNSEEVEDCWFLRNLMSINGETKISQHDLDHAHNKYLQYFDISDISQVDFLIDKVFNESYGIVRNDVEERVVKSNVNKNSVKKIAKMPFSELDDTTKEKFLDRTYWDRKLWERYCK